MTNIVARFKNDRETLVVHQDDFQGHINKHWPTSVWGYIQCTCMTHLDEHHTHLSAKSLQVHSLKNYVGDWFYLGPFDEILNNQQL